MKIEGQVIYLGPMIRGVGLYFSKTWRDGVHDANVYKAIEQCRAIAELIVPVTQTGYVLRELNFDYAHNMRGTTGKHPTFYREVQKWLAQRKQPQTSGVKLHHA